MTRFTLVAVAALMLAAAPVVAQTTAPQASIRAKASQQTTAPDPAAEPAPGSEEWLRLRGETYSAASEAEQNPAEVAETIRLNAGIAARNEAAERQEAEAAAAWEAEDARWRAETARLATERTQWEAEMAVAEAARLRYERDRAAWEAEVAACQRSPRPCVIATPR